jgi:protein-tyrosine phosphatase
MRDWPPIVDIHSHVLAGLDDGPDTWEESLAMCRRYADGGICTVVATPHFGAPVFRVTPERVRCGVKKLTRLCGERGIALDILPGGDVRVGPDLLDEFDKGRIMTLADRGRHVMLEMPFQTAPRIEELLFQFALRGVTAVLSHPERNLELQRKPERVNELVELGCLLQITGGSLLGHFGRAARRAAEGLLRSGCAHVVASDAHSPRGHRMPAFARTIERLCRLVGEQAARRLLCETPGRLARAEAPCGAAAPLPPGGRGKRE